MVSAFTTAESTATAVESVVASFVPLPPQATNVVAIAKIAITFFIFLLFVCLNCLLFIVTLISMLILDFFDMGPAKHQSLILVSYPTQLLRNVLAFFNDVSY